MAEWLRRKIRNLLGSARAGSNPAVVVIFLKFFSYYIVSLSFLLGSYLPHEENKNAAILFCSRTSFLVYSLFRIGNSIFYLWHFYCLLFVCIFRILRLHIQAILSRFHSIFYVNGMWRFVNCFSHRSLRGAEELTLCAQSVSSLSHSVCYDASAATSLAL